LISINDAYLLIDYRIKQRRCPKLDAFPRCHASCTFSHIRHHSKQKYINML